VVILTSAGGRGARANSFLGLVLAWAALATGCYNPKIEEGAFLCDDGGACPEGFACTGGRCYKASTPTAACPLCVPPAGTTGACDPICQTGCPCSQKCMPAAPAPSCAPLPAKPKEVSEVCQPARDECRAGSVCVLDRTDNSACGAHCYRMCRANSDCGPKARCLEEIDIAGTNQSYGLCSNEIETCNPLAPMAKCDRPDRPVGTFGCYVLSSKEPDLTVCECAGKRKEGETCPTMHSCEPGLECVEREPGKFFCHQLCRPEGSNVQVAVNCRNLAARCIPFPGGRGRFGYCM
jgi:hypothetical protein